MTHTGPFYDADGNEVEPPAPKDLRAALAREQEQREALEAQVAANQATADAGLARENAMLKAGIDVTTPVGKMFAGSFDGELTDLEAIQAAAREVGALAPVATETEQERIDREAQEAREAVVAGGQPPPTQDELDNQQHPTDLGLKRFNDAMQTGQTRDKAAAGFFNTVIGAAMQGDERVLWEPTPEQREALAT